ncbi:Zn-ribbon domain-containing OB-fold protein [Cupriavidus pauculus]|uniref:Zn-ribbon domain-containing OB-fold protein n=1 Tax=Cupriavidus pauculus TaxID=82633 RepID=UPI001EE1CCA7|nr:OB-fold domain-containing protein [Cupriavidus pauculus]GJG95456.1 DNA-binding protein [Cupriavidus pauculus]
MSTPTPESIRPPLAPYTAGLAAGVVRYQVCETCAAWQPLQRHACRACGGLHLAWRDGSGNATVHAVTEVFRAPTEAFQALVPYTLVLATLDEGPRVMGHAEPGIAIGDRVRATVFEVEGQPLLRFIRA